MRQAFLFVIGAVLVVSPVRSAMDGPPSEADIEARLKALQQQQNELRAKEDQLKKELAAAKTRAFGGIKAEMKGIMNRDSNGFYILSRLEQGQEQRVWLMISDEPMKARYEALLGGEVIATGQLRQKAERKTPALPEIPGAASLDAYIPSGGMYFDKQVDVRGAGTVSHPPVVAPPPVSFVVPPSVPPVVPSIPK